ncbi:uncharacterized protein MAM_00695 [Metarhizium album ARSEF 1941]|uniref:DUF7918 domain-containing protein n=1 Tax=Metarhizium album (strain ARSEF 1941) TaxID=1081103 RepID=A0A0B2X5N6_METAS|nr:uncharacterized protein MAM_00695 [Metarhizium album ARSEF 1941]KHO01694.1 hypothetical protein MAM_00695 [Metarhizium album ARSEF 1941]
MPCFKGIAVSIHANGAPLPEYGMQKQSRVSRISTYIPVPQPKLTADSNKPEPAKFAISITLLTPGLAIPYSAPKSCDSNPFPKPQYVNSLQPGSGPERGKYSGMVSPYIPMTHSENETIAAYIYFDGRAKEEVATLLRPGEETWVNSRWVQVPDAEGGGLAEREFLFREVGLERWLNGLDLQGHDAAEKLERRRQKFEKRRRRQTLVQEASAGANTSGAQKDTLRYGADDGSPIEPVFDSDSWSDDDDEPPEATGQIKVAMFRVLASGEIKKGEYSPQFDAHDGDDEAGNNDNVAADVEHTTSFAKPKSLDPKTISTQTVTGIDGPDRPYAVFTFFYRGERQLQKIGVMQSSKNPSATPGSAKRRSGQLDLSGLGPLKAGGTVGFSAFRDQTTETSRRRKARKKSNGNIAVDSDEEDEDESDNLNKMEDDYKDGEDKEASEDSKFGGELADGVNRIRLKRAHSADPDSHSTPETSQRGQAEDSPVPQVPPSLQPPSAVQAVSDLPADALVGSPLKKARPSVDVTNTGEKLGSTQSLSEALDAVVSTTAAPAETATTSTASPSKVDEEEEL